MAAPGPAKTSRSFTNNPRTEGAGSIMGLATAAVVAIVAVAAAVMLVGDASLVPGFATEVLRPVDDSPGPEGLWVTIIRAGHGGHDDHGTRSDTKFIGRETFRELTKGRVFDAATGVELKRWADLAAAAPEGAGPSGGAVKVLLDPPKPGSSPFL